MDFLVITKRARKRLLHHLLITSVCFALAGLFYAVLFQFYPESQSWVFRWSLATGYIAALLLAATLTLGALNILRGRVNPVSSDLRRDIGIWCALFSLAHVGFGLNVHMQRWTQYFFDDAGKLLTDAFGFANYLGVLATIIALALLATSNDVSLRYFRRERWKKIQRLNYLFVFLVVAHSFVYQFVEKRLLTFGFIFGVIALWILIIQFAGFRKRRREMQISTTVPQN
jgi:sulfoxide reductase heme-binding subunit YedZ